MPRPVVKRTARAILLDGDPQSPELVLIKRTKPGRPPYWITPGGCVESTDPTVVDALHRELSEELGGKAGNVVPAFVDTVSTSLHDAVDGGTAAAGPDEVKVQHFFACRVESIDLAQRHGPEVDEPNGEYEVVRLPFTREGVTSVNVVPSSLRAYLAANIEGITALLADDLGPR
ncbi:NUDIX domain-containing protein [Streptacidiphilus carbonis]|uniref:NUDIX domain-containing protein n=1 Tax=Streptacidiphilus carbonis TaxID=105422 RepID=UPI0005AB4D15|nr:NUDIX hydrolase [Streptacidiphilus carbonis]